MTWEPRTYRRITDAAGLVTFEVVYAETDLQISATRELRADATRVARELRADIEGYIGAHPLFAETFAPLDVEPGAPEVVRAMAAAGVAAGVGPMAAVAGAIAERVARALAAASPEVIVENGGDLFLIGTTPRRVLLLAGDSPLSGRTAIDIPGSALPLGVCTSSGRVGHSVSLGRSHATTIMAKDAALADAAATAVGNVVHGPDDVDAGLSRAMGIAGVTGAVIIADDRIGAAGDVSLVPAGNAR